MRTWMGTALTVALFALSATQLSCSVNDYCLGCDTDDAGNGDGGGSGSDGGFMDAMVDAGCVPTNAGFEKCDGLDNDCNGLVDDGVVEDVGDLCANQNGVCAGGVLQCVTGDLVCTKNPSPETCDMLDNNCNGSTDEGDPGGGGKCGTDLGECVAGTLRCNAATGTIDCLGFIDATTGNCPTCGPELCDAKDNNCNGQFDEGITSLGPCGPTTNNGECMIGTLMCSGGSPICNGAIFPKFETCNNLNDDCDANTDEIFNKLTDPTNCGSCGVICQPKSKTCINSTTPSVNGTTCTVNSDCAPGGTCAINSQPRCAPNTASPPVGTCGFTCNAGFRDLDLAAANGCEYRCFVSGSEECDGVDNDCDGMIDEPADLVAPAICLSGGECGVTAPTATCGGPTGWSCTYTGVVQFPETRCDGLNNDCDANIDEFQAAPVPGLGDACTEESETICSGMADDDLNGTDGLINDGCPIVGTAETICNDALDNDSDGAVNDGCPAVARRGVCKAIAGIFQCNTTSEAARNGPAVCLITMPGQATPDLNETCNDKDDDCDGNTDEGSAAGNLLGQEWVTLPAGRQIMKYEASKPDANTTDPGAKTTAVCSKASVQPWINVSYPQAVAACASMGATLCGENEWQRACSVVSGTTYPVAVSGTGTFIEAEAYAAIAAGDAAETVCNNAADDDGDGRVNDGCATVGTAEAGSACFNSLDDDSDGSVNDGCPKNGPAWVPDYTAGFSGTTALEATPNLGGSVTIAQALTLAPRIDFPLDVTTASANYHVWVKMFANTVNDNVVHVGMTGLTTRTATGTLTNAWHWVDAGVFNVAATGNFTVSVWMGEDGVKIDKIYIVNGTTNPAGTDVLAPAGNRWAFATSPNTYNPNTCNGHDFVQVNIATTSRANTGIVTVTTSVAHSLTVGRTVQIASVVDATFNGTFQVATVPNTTSFTYIQNSLIAAASTGGTATDATDNTLVTGSLASCQTSTGIFDMSGNVREWTLAHVAGENPIRGGAANSTADGISCPLAFTLADDTFFFPNIGFRCCRPTP